MKALVIKDDNGGEYEDYQDWITDIFVVPDHFDDSKDYREYLADAAAKGEIRLKKSNGVPYNEDQEKARAGYVKSLSARFQKLEVVSEMFWWK